MKKASPLTGFKFSAPQEQGRHFTTLPGPINAVFLRHCTVEKRQPPELLRIIVEDYYEMKRQEAEKFSQITGQPLEESVTPRFGPKPEGHRGHTREQIEGQGQT